MIQIDLIKTYMIQGQVQKHVEFYEKLVHDEWNNYKKPVKTNNESEASKRRRKELLEYHNNKNK